MVGQVSKLNIVYRGTLVILDSEDVIVMVMVGKPLELSEEQSMNWDSQVARFAEKVEDRRARNEAYMSSKANHHSRGDYATVNFGFGYGNGRTVRIAF